MTADQQRQPACMRRWMAARLAGIGAVYRRHVSAYRVPKTLNIWYCFGALALALICNQFATGVFLAIHYLPRVAEAFLSVQQTVMRDVPFGWLVRTMHTTGASLLCVVLILHIVRAFLYGSYRKPREIVWLLGLALYGVVMSEAFTGYVLPWGQMSFWGAKVIASLTHAVPWIGTHLVEWIFGAQRVGDATLGRFFIIHIVILPACVIGLLVLHIVALHHVGSSDPRGGRVPTQPLDHRTVRRLAVKEIPFHPYYTVKDLCALSGGCCIAALLLFEAPQCGGFCLEPENAVPANPFVTPEHIRSAWYFSPFFAVLRGVPGQFPALLICVAAIALPWFLPWLDRGPVYALHQRPWRVRSLFLLIGVCILGLGILGVWENAAAWQTMAVRSMTALYFALFMTMPIWSRQHRPSTYDVVGQRG